VGKTRAVGHPGPTQLANAAADRALHDAPSLERITTPSDPLEPTAMKPPAAVAAPMSETLGIAWGSETFVQAIPGIAGSEHAASVTPTIARRPKARPRADMVSVPPVPLIASNPAEPSNRHRTGCAPRAVTGHDVACVYRTFSESGVTEWGATASDA